MLKAYKYRIYSDREQSERINRTIGVCRLVYHLALKIRIWAWQGGVKMSSIDLCYQLVALKKEYPWIAEVDSQALQAAVKIVDVAFDNFFRGKGYPKFKKKRNGGSFQCPNNKREVDWDRSTLTIPKIPDIPLVLSRKFEGKIKTVTISKTPTGKYFASILVETNQCPVIPPKPQKAIGIDLGITSFAVLSTGEKIGNSRFLKKSLKKLKRKSREASRKKKGSRNQQKAYRKLALIHEKVANQRQDMLHKVSTRIIRENQADTICVETLKVKNMIKNPSLAQAIADVAWGEFVRQLEYKGKWHGKNVVKVDQWFASSKTCSHCGHKLEELELSVREWTCENCQATHDRDINAAKNIESMGLKTAVGSREEPVEAVAIATPGKQEDILVKLVY